MNAPLDSTPQGRWPRALPWAVAGLILGVYALMLLWLNLQLRSGLRAQIARRDAQVLHSVARLQDLTLAEPAVDPEEAVLSPTGPGLELGMIVQADRLQEVVSRLKGVLGVRLFRPDGAMITALPPSLTDAELTSADLGGLRRFQPVAHFRRAMRAEDLFLDAPRRQADWPAPQPVLETLVPLTAGAPPQLVGVAQLVLDGQGVAAEFAALDRRLWVQGLGLLLAGSASVGAGLAWAFGRLERAHRLLAQRTADLLKANAELALSAKTSAVGAVAAHLLHGLKNPLSGLQSFVASRTDGSPPGEEPEWAEAARTARRMQNMVQEVVRVLHEEDGVTRYELDCGELAQLALAKAGPQAQRAGVALRLVGQARGVVSNREANLVLLILENLLGNAFDATSRGKSVALELETEPTGVAFRVRDEGPGLPEAVRQRLFTPGGSTKPGGTGVGLAISRQLASHLGATLELESSTAQGCVFALRLPRNAPPRQPA